MLFFGMFETLIISIIQFSIHQSSNRFEDINVGNNTANQHTFEKSFALELQLIKANETIEKLQKRCAEKTALINRLRASEWRLRLSRSNLQGILNDFKKKKWVTEEGQHILNVNEQISSLNCI